MHKYFVNITVTWDKTPNSLVQRHQHFRRTFSLHLQERRWKAGGFSETPIPISQTTRRHIPQNCNINNKHCKTFKFHFITPSRE
jgi:hypothetical protein